MRSKPSSLDYKLYSQKSEIITARLGIFPIFPVGMWFELDPHWNICNGKVPSLNKALI